MAVSRDSSARIVDPVTQDVIWRTTINKEFWTDKSWFDNFGGITGSGKEVQARRNRIFGEVAKEYQSAKAARQAARVGNLKNAWQEAGEKQLKVDEAPDVDLEAAARRRAAAAPTPPPKAPVPGPTIQEAFPRRVPEPEPPQYTPYYYDEQLVGWEGLAAAGPRNQHGGVKSLPVAPHRVRPHELSRGRPASGPSLAVAGEVSHPNRLKKGLTKPPQYTPAEVLSAHMREQRAKQAHLDELSLPYWLQQERAKDRERKEARRRAKSAQPRPAPADENHAPEPAPRAPEQAAAAAPEKPRPFSAAATLSSGNVTVVNAGIEPPRRIQASHGSAAYERGTARGRGGAGLAGPAAAVSDAELPMRERLAKLEPKEKYLRPLTTYMELGWNLKKPMVPVGLELFGVAEHANGHAKDLMPAYFGIGSR